MTAKFNTLPEDIQRRIVSLAADAATSTGDIDAIAATGRLGREAAQSRVGAAVRLAARHGVERGELRAAGGAMEAASLLEEGANGWRARTEFVRRPCPAIFGAQGLTPVASPAGVICLPGSKEEELKAEMALLTWPPGCTQEPRVTAMKIPENQRVLQLAHDHLFSEQVYPRASQHWLTATFIEETAGGGWRTRLGVWQTASGDLVDASPWTTGGKRRGRKDWPTPFPGYCSNGWGVDDAGLATLDPQTGGVLSWTPETGWYPSVASREALDGRHILSLAVSCDHIWLAARKSKRVFFEGDEPCEFEFIGIARQAKNLQDGATFLRLSIHLDGRVARAHHMPAPGPDGPDPVSFYAMSWPGQSPREFTFGPSPAPAWGEVISIAANEGVLVAGCYFARQRYQGGQVYGILSLRIPKDMSEHHVSGSTPRFLRLPEIGVPLLSGGRVAYPNSCMHGLWMEAAGDLVDGRLRHAEEPSDYTGVGEVRRSQGSWSATSSGLMSCNWKTGEAIEYVTRGQERR